MFHRRGIFLSIYGTQSFTLNLVRFPTSAVPNSLCYRLVDFQLFLWERKKNVGFHFAPGLEQNTKEIKFYRATLVYIILNFFLRSL